MVLRPVAPFSQSMSPWRATATHFESKNIDFARFVNPLCVMWTYKSYFLSIEYICVAKIRFPVPQIEDITCRKYKILLFRSRKLILRR